MANETILPVASVREFFEGAVRAAIAAQRLDPDPATAGYLVDVLCDYARRPPTLDEPLSVLMARARHRLGTQRMGQLKRVGDHSLYVAGYFNPSLARRRLDLDYYREMGGTAYRRLSQLLRRQRQAARLRAVYTELADDFHRFVKVLAKVRSDTEPGEEPTEPAREVMSDELIGLYKRWRRERSGTLEKRLRAAGMVIGDGDGEGEAN